MDRRTWQLADEQQREMLHWAEHERLADSARERASNASAGQGWRWLILMLVLIVVVGGLATALQFSIVP
jgi:hypothetical protein